MGLNREHLHKKLHHYIFSVIQPAFSYANEYIKDEKLRKVVINNLKTRGNSQRNRAVDEYEYYMAISKEDLLKFLKGILIFISDIAYNELYTVLKLRIDNWEEVCKKAKEELDKRLNEDIKMLEGEI